MPRSKSVEIASSNVPLKRSERLLKRAASQQLKILPNEESTKSLLKPSRKATQKSPKSKTKVVNLASQKNLENSSKAVVRRHPVMCMICKKSFTSKKKLKDHNTKHHYLRHCPNCPKTFKQTRKFMLHLQSHLEYYPYDCKYCLESYNDRIDLLLHQKKSHTESRIKPNPWPCVACSEVFPNFSLRNRHLTEHNGPPYSCPNCDAVFSKAADRIVHIKNHVYRCHLCLYEVVTFPTYIELDSHVWRFHQMGDDQNESKIMGTLDQFASTGSVNLDDEDGCSDSMDELPSDYDEDDAVEDSSYQKDAVEPVYNLKRKDKFICFICFDLYPTCELLKLHMKGHKWYPCNCCPKFFSDADTFAKHECDFAVVPSLRCEICSCETKCESCMEICIRGNDIAGVNMNGALPASKYFNHPELNLLDNFIEHIKFQDGPTDFGTLGQIGFHYICQQILKTPRFRSLYHRYIPIIEDLYSKRTDPNETVLKQLKK